MWATLDEIIIKLYWGLKVWIYNIFLSPFFIFMNLWQFLLPAGIRSKVAKITMKKTVWNSYAFSRAHWQSHEKFCSFQTQSSVIFQTKEYELKIKELWYFGVSFQVKPFFHARERKPPEIQLCFPRGTLDLRKGKQKTQNSHPGPDPQKGSVMHWSGPLIMVTRTRITFSSFCALRKQECHGEDSTDNIAYEVGSISSSVESGKLAVLNIFSIFPWIVRVCCYQYPKPAF